MSAAASAEGVWRVLDKSDGSGHTLLEDGYGNILARVSSGSQQLMDARLMAAAPTLLGALLQISFCSQNSASSKEQCGQIARNAIKEIAP